MSDQIKQHTRMKKQQQILPRPKFLLIFLIRKVFRVVLKKIVSVIFILCTFLGFFLIYSSTKTVYPSITNEHVDTHSYLSEYKNWLEVKKKFPGSKFKTVLKNKRELKQTDLFNMDFLILEYTTIFGQSKYCQHFSDLNKVFYTEKESLYLKECPYKNCLFTCDKNVLNDANALIFSAPDLEKLLETEMDLLENLLDQVIERQNQVWILWNDEANLIPKNFDNFYFNWTMSYRAESEVSDCSYGCKYKVVKRNEENFIFKIKQEFLVRNNTAVWFISNCDPKYRITFAKSLKKIYPVKAFGSCSSFLDHEYLFKFINYMLSERCSRNSGCEHEQLTKNKFYLSFESKNCSNYLTEKVWKMLHIGIIPVVIQPSKQFYELKLPPNSFIHAQDFDYDAQKLANYLNHVANDFDTYYSYLKWKLEYQVVFSAYQTERRRLCELCTRLNTEDSLIYYNSVSDFFNDQCIIN